VFFFDGGPPAALAASPSGGDVMIQKLLTAARDRVGIQLKESSQNSIATVAETNRFQAGEEATLLFVEQAIEQQNGSFELVR
jgi:hypothetical protein